MKVVQIYLGYDEISDKEKLVFLKYHIGYEGKYEKQEILNFLDKKFSRQQVPKIKHLLK